MVRLRGVTPVAGVGLVDAHADLLRLLRHLWVRVQLRAGLLGTLRKKRHSEIPSSQLLPLLLCQVMYPPHHRLPAVGLLLRLVQMRMLRHRPVQLLPLRPERGEGLRAQSPAVHGGPVDLLQILGAVLRHERHEGLELLQGPALAGQRVVAGQQVRVQRAAHGSLVRTPVSVPWLLGPCPLHIFHARDAGAPGHSRSRQCQHETRHGK
mmetsp:Transcript_133022/g.315289  ORF Transcript_133022/g.315289 Transcript_133022/m.315289 type:complete len:208 (+) Transcript_133022:1499-2122(+)